MSEYRVGDRVLLFLIPDYLDGKVTYPVGLYQGAFYVSTMPSGQELARNSINNLDLFTANQYDNTVSVLFGNGDGTFQAAASYTTGFGPTFAVASDFTGDSKPDLLVVNQYDNNVMLMTNKGSGTFNTPTKITVGDTISVSVGLAASVDGANS